MSLGLLLIHVSAFFNDVTYVSPKVPTLYSVLSTGSNATNPAIYGSNTNAFVLAQNEVIEIVLNNNDPGKYVPCTLLYPLNLACTYHANVILAQTSLPSPRSRLPSCNPQRRGWRRLRRWKHDYTVHHTHAS